MNKSKGILGMALTMALMAETAMHGYSDAPREYIPNNKKPELKPQKGQFYYWFREDGSFLNEKQGERMRREDCVFTCFSINDKNAIKKFNSFMNSKKTEETNATNNF